jgi:hypothetical protein
MMKDPEFIAEANKSMLKLDGLNGVGLVKIINDTIEVPPELASGANFYISKRRGRSVAIGPKRASRVYSLHGRFDVRRKPKRHLTVAMLATHVPGANRAEP